MAYFEKDFLEFFKELAANNNKDWFDTNRKRYENIVREPFKNFVSLVINEVHKHDSSINIEAKDAIFRINRDVRFSKDKTPYKLHVGAVVSKLGRKDKLNAGVYFELGPEHLGFFGGARLPDKIQLENLRRYIIANNEEFERLITSNDFSNHFPDGIKGEKNKRLPKDLLESAKKQELIFNKQFYYQAFLDPREITTDRLLDIIIEHYLASKAVNDYLTKAMNQNF